MEKNLIQITAELRNKGFEEDFMVARNDTLKVVGSEQYFKPSELKIKDSYRLEGQSNPSDMLIVFGLESLEEPKVRGVFIEPYGSNVTKQQAAISQQLVKDDNGTEAVL